MKRLTLVFLVLILVVTALPLAAMAEEKYTITFWHTDADTLIVNPLQHLIDEFETANPNIDIELTAWPADSYYQKYITAIATNTAPDIFSTRDTEMLAMVGMDALLPLNEYIDNWEGKDQIPQSIWDSINLYSDEGYTYMIPTYMNLCCNWYNLSRLEEEGVEIPTTQEEFISYCEQFADPDNGSYFYTLRGGAGCYDNMFTYLMTYAGADNFFDEDGVCVIDGEEFVKGLEEYASIYINGWCSRDSITNAAKQMMAEFGAGTVTMLQHNSTSFATLRTYMDASEIINGGPLAGKDGIAAQPAPNIFGAAISSTCEHPEIAVQFIQYLAEHEAASYFCDAAGKTPINDLVYDDEWVQDDPFLSTYTEMLNDGNIVFYQNPIWLEAWTDLINTTVVEDFQAILLGEKTAQEALTNWASILTESQQAYLAAK